MKVTIVGAGPAGLYTALLLKQYGFSPKILEEHREIGKPVRCAGIVGREVFEDLALPLSKRSIINQIDGAAVCFRDDNFLIRREGVAYVIDREIFDKELGKGLRIEYNTRFLSFERRGSGYLIKTDRGDFYSDIIIGADGTSSQVRREAQLSKGIKYYKGVQFRIRTKPKSTNLAEVHFKSPFFSWVIPEGDGILRVGTLLRSQDRASADFIGDLGIEGKIVDKVGGLIPIGYCKTVEGNVALVGDAACQVKPLTGGGIYYGLKSAEVLVRCIRDGKLATYDRKWKELFGGEIRFGVRVRGILGHMNDKTLGVLFDLAKENSGLISKIGDFENHSSIFWELIKNPKTHKICLTLFGKMIKVIKT